MATTGSLASISWSTTVGGTYTTVPAVGSATYTLNRPPLEITSLGDGNASFLTGVQNATATLDIFYDNDDANHIELFDNINGAENAIAVKLTLETDESIQGLAYVTNFDITATNGDVTRASVQLQFTGAITNTHTA